ncbi:hypothetical protein ACL02U_28265 [Streptomyces sp. MS06]|uniref:hypothetical protein n=1 Tax=Streptomyces sp. MS06 TaxID=3385974 RepID=UPI0039A2296C
MAPDSLCGISIESGLLDDFLPGGDSLKVAKSSPNGGTERCDVLVDKDLTVRFTNAWWGDGDDAHHVAAAYAKMENGKLTQDERYVYSGRGAVGKTDKNCKSPEHPDQDLYAIVQVFTADHSDSDAMKQLITTYTSAVNHSAECK